MGWGGRNKCGEVERGGSQMDRRRVRYADRRRKEEGGGKREGEAGGRLMQTTS